MLVCGLIGVLCLLPCFFSPLLSCFCSEARKSSTSHMVPYSEVTSLQPLFLPSQLSPALTAFFREALRW